MPCCGVPKKKPKSNRSLRTPNGGYATKWPKGSVKFKLDDQLDAWATSFYIPDLRGNFRKTVAGMFDDPFHTMTPEQFKAWLLARNWINAAKDYETHFIDWKDHRQRNYNLRSVANTHDIEITISDVFIDSTGLPVRAIGLIHPNRYVTVAAQNSFLGMLTDEERRQVILALDPPDCSDPLSHKQDLDKSPMCTGGPNYMDAVPVPSALDVGIELILYP